MAQTKQTQTYAELSGRLDEIVRALESPSLDIDEAMKLYEEGASLVAELEHYLRTAENRISKLKVNTTESE